MDVRNVEFCDRFKISRPNAKQKRLNFNVFAEQELKIVTSRENTTANEKARFWPQNANDGSILTENTDLKNKYLIRFGENCDKEVNRSNFNLLCPAQKLVSNSTEKITQRDQSDAEEDDFKKPHALRNLSFVSASTSEESKPGSLDQSDSSSPQMPGEAYQKNRKTNQKKKINPLRREKIGRS